MHCQLINITNVLLVRYFTTRCSLGKSSYPILLPIYLYIYFFAIHFYRSAKVRSSRLTLITEATRDHCTAAGLPTYSYYLYCQLPLYPLLPPCLTACPVAHRTKHKAFDPLHQRLKRIKYINVVVQDRPPLSSQSSSYIRSKEREYVIIPVKLNNCVLKAVMRSI